MERKKKQLRSRSRSLSRCTVGGRQRERERPAGELYKGAKTIVVSASEARLITPDQVTKSAERGGKRKGSLAKKTNGEREEIIIKNGSTRRDSSRSRSRRRKHTGYCTKGSAVQMAPQRDHIDLGLGNRTRSPAAAAAWHTKNFQYELIIRSSQHSGSGQTGRQSACQAATDWGGRHSSTVRQLVKEAAKDMRHSGSVGEVTKWRHFIIMAP